MSADRMSALDAFFFYTEEDGRNLMHVGGVAVCEGRAPTAAEVAAALKPKIASIPRYRQRVRPVRLHLHRPEWIGAPEFDIREHVRSVRAAAPGHEGLREAVAEFISYSIDRTRPLWEVLVVNGLGANEFAIAWKIHHSMVDGVSGTELLTILFDDTPKGGRAPAPAVVDESTGHGTLRAAVDLGRETTRRVVAGLRPATARRAVQVAASGAVLSAANLLVDYRSPLVGRVGPERAFDFCAVPFDDIRTIRKAFGGTVNDVVLTVVLAGFRDLLVARGIDVAGKDLRLMNPVALRARDAAGRPLGDGTMETKASALMPKLPLYVANPVARLGIVRERLETLKATGQADALNAFNEVTALLPGTLNKAYLRSLSIAPPRAMQTTVTNVHGPTMQLYLLGRPLRTIANYAPPFPIGARSSVTVYSYGGQLVFGVTTDRKSLPEADLIVAGIRTAMTDLAARARI